MLSLLPAHASNGAASARPCLADRRRAACSLHQPAGPGRSSCPTPAASSAAYLEGLSRAAHPAGWAPRRAPSVAAHVAAPYPAHQLMRQAPPSVDPASSLPPSADQQLVRLITTPAEFQQLQERHSGKLLVLMCKARSCRPCKAFAKRYQALAKAYPDALFLDVYGDDTMELRGMMMHMKIKATPTFRLFRGSQQVASLTGANANKLSDAIQGNLRLGEAGYVEPEQEAEPESEPAAMAAAESS